MNKNDDRKSRRDWLKWTGGAIAGTAVTGATLECCKKPAEKDGDSKVKAALQTCHLPTTPTGLNVVLHGMSVIGVFDNGIRVVLPYIDGHVRVWGTLTTKMPKITPGWYTLMPFVTTSNPKLFDAGHEVLLRKTDGLTFSPSRPKTQPNEPSWVVIDMPRPNDCLPFRSASRDFSGTAKDTYKIYPGDFPMGHVLVFTGWGASATFCGPKNMPVPVSASGIFSNFHIYNENPCGAHPMHHLKELNDLFSPPLQLDIVDSSAGIGGPGCGLQDNGISALDQCDLKELKDQGIPFDGDDMQCQMNMVNAADPATCLSYVYDDTQPPPTPAKK